MKNWVKLVIALAISQLVAASGAYFTVTGTGSWYQTLDKPSWNPPSWVFGPVWTTLYVLMGIAMFLVWRSDVSDKLKRKAIILWSVQLFFNFLWSFLFFGQQQIFGALLEILVLWFFILLTISAFARVNKLAAWLLVPYISWVSFATILTYTIWDLNR